MSNRTRFQTTVKIVTNTLTQEVSQFGNGNLNRICQENIAARAIESDLYQCRKFQNVSKKQQVRSEVFIFGLYGE